MNFWHRRTITPLSSHSRNLRKAAQELDQTSHMIDYHCRRLTQLVRAHYCSYLLKKSISPENRSQKTLSNREAIRMWNRSRRDQEERPNSFWSVKIDRDVVTNKNPKIIREQFHEELKELGDFILRSTRNDYSHLWALAEALETQFVFDRSEYGALPAKPNRQNSSEFQIFYDHDGKKKKPGLEELLIYRIVRFALFHLPAEGINCYRGPNRDFFKTDGIPIIDSPSNPRFPFNLDWFAEGKSPSRAYAAIRFLSNALNQIEKGEDLTQRYHFSLQRFDQKSTEEEIRAQFTKKADEEILARRRIITAFRGAQKKMTVCAKNAGTKISEATAGWPNRLAYGEAEQSLETALASFRDLRKISWSAEEVRFRTPKIIRQQNDKKAETFLQERAEGRRGFRAARRDEYLLKVQLLCELEASFPRSFKPNRANRSQENFSSPQNQFSLPVQTMAREPFLSTKQATY